MDLNLDTIFGVLYILAMIGGLVWIIERVIAYQRREREREARSSELLADEEFRVFINELKKKNQSQGEAQGIQSETTGVSPGSLLDKKQ